jgi:hypothetical protein
MNYLSPPAATSNLIDWMIQTEHSIAFGSDWTHSIMPERMIHDPEPPPE